MSVHHHPHDQVHPHAPGPLIDRRALLRAGGLGLGAILLAACKSGSSATSTTPSPEGAATTIAALTTLPGFHAFAATVRTFVEGDYWLVESNGMPTHNVMVGITSWQQQVPLPQPYTGANAWRFTATPEMAVTPRSTITGMRR